MDLLESERIILRPLQLKDAADVFSYRSDPLISRYQNWQPESMADVEEFLAKRIIGEPDRPDTWFQLAICKKDPHEFIGDCGLHFPKDESRQVEVGITLKRDHHGMGYATETMGLIFDYVFGDLKKHRIYASVDPNNRASIRLLERMKMRKEAHFVATIWVKDHWVDDLIYAILEQEWNATRCG